MYIPTAFAEDEPRRIHDFVRSNSFATLVTAVDDAPFATHLPLLLEEDGQVLLGHMARANPQWRSFRPDQETLAIFSGPHCYVSPRWYEAGPSVPTWNYAAVHVYGVPRMIEDPGAVRSLLRKTASVYEGRGPDAWAMDGLPEAYLASMQRGIVAFEIPMTRVEAKFKLSQNRAAADRMRVAEALARSEDPLDRSVSVLMRERETERS